MNVSSGSMPLPKGFDPGSATWSKLRQSAKYPGPIIADPDPGELFPHLRWYLLLLWSCALLPILGAFFLRLRPFHRKYADRAAPRTSKRAKQATALLVVCWLAFSVPPALGLIEYGRVDFLATLALKVVYALTILGAAHAIVRLYAQKRPIAGFFSSAAIIGWVYFMWATWWFT
jgi:hypothetical protein